MLVITRGYSLWIQLYLLEKCFCYDFQGEPYLSQRPRIHRDQICNDWHPQQCPGFIKIEGPVTGVPFIIMKTVAYGKRTSMNIPTYQAGISFKSVQLGTDDCLATCAARDAARRMTGGGAKHCQGLSSFDVRVQFRYVFCGDLLGDISDNPLQLSE